MTRIVTEMFEEPDDATPLTLEKVCRVLTLAFGTPASVRQLVAQQMVCLGRQILWSDA